MHVWLVQTAEFHPFQVGARKMRTAMLADALRTRGHTITWWSSNFFHPTKTLLAPGYDERVLGDGYVVKLIEGLPYQKNVSLRRYAHYKLLARRFRKLSHACAPPDLILAALPDTDLSAEMVRYAKARAIPVLVDIQDLWPDSFLQVIPERWRWMGRMALAHDLTRVERMLRDADGLIACSNAYLDWGLAKIGRERGANDRVFFHGYPDTAAASSESLDPSFTQKLDSLEGKMVLTFVGTFGHSYDVSAIVDAAARLRATHPAVHFVLAGQGEQLGAIEQRSAGLSNVTLTGWIGKNEIAALLARSDIGLATYNANATQSLSYKPFEYLAHRLPIISSLPGEMAALLDRHGVGLTYEAGSLDDFLRTVTALAEDPTRVAQMSRLAESAFEANFSAGRIYGAYAEHLETVQRISTRAA